MGGFAAALLLTGLGFKVAVAPFHAWAPDVYDGAPAPVSGFLATGVKAAGFAALTRVFTELTGFSAPLSAGIAAIAVLTMFLGNLRRAGQPPSSACWLIRPWRTRDTWRWVWPWPAGPGPRTSSIPSGSICWRIR